MSDFKKELEQLINKHSRENNSNTPDFILADYMLTALMTFESAVNRREHWYAKNMGVPIPEDKDLL